MSRYPKAGNSLVVAESSTESFLILMMSSNRNLRGRMGWPGAVGARLYLRLCRSAVLPEHHRTVESDDLGLLRYPRLYKDGAELLFSDPCYRR